MKQILKILHAHIYMYMQLPRIEFFININLVFLKSWEDNWRKGISDVDIRPFGFYNLIFSFFINKSTHNIIDNIELEFLIFLTLENKDVE